MRIQQQSRALLEHALLPFGNVWQRIGETALSILPVCLFFFRKQDQEQIFVSDVLYRRSFSVDDLGTASPLHNPALSTQDDISHTFDSIFYNKVRLHCRRARSTIVHSLILMPLGESQFVQEPVRSVPLCSRLRLSNAVDTSQLIDFRTDLDSFTGVVGLSASFSSTEDKSNRTLWTRLSVTFDTE